MNFNPEFVATASLHSQKYAVLKDVKEKFSLTMFSCLTVEYLTSLESEMKAKPYIINEAVTFMESINALGAFMSSEDTTVSQVFIDLIRKVRTPKVMTQSFHEDTMESYFMQNDGEAFLNANPAFLGIYMYLFFSGVGE